MKIAYYCQHVLGIGHVHRSLEVCRALATDQQVTMIVGGPELIVEEPTISLLQLPGIKMDERFSTLIPCSPLPLESIKRQRCERLLEFITSYQPDCMIIELYPFGRKQFRFELDPLLMLLSEMDCPVFCSLRDILVEKTEGQVKFERRAVETMNSFFTGLLIHADARIVRLEKTFANAAAIKADSHYTGFVTPHPAGDSRDALRAQLGLAPSTPLIVASIGSGSVGIELLEAVARAVKMLHQKGHELMLQVFTGVYADPARCKHLHSLASHFIRIERFSTSFIDWLAAADVSISMAGYNTTMNVLAAGTPALMLPFDQNREQRMRIERLRTTHDILLIEPDDLAAPKLMELILMALKRQRYVSSVDLDGAARTAEIIKGYLSI